MAKIEQSTPEGFRRIKRKGGRVVFDPSKNIRKVHRHFLNNMKNFPIPRGNPGYEVAKHLRKGHRFFLSTDLENAFDQVTAKHLADALQSRGIPRKWLIPRKFFFHDKGKGGLIQGALCSPYLFETYCRYGGLDSEIGKYCETLGFHYSRYVDDILISSPRNIGRRVSPSIRAIVEKFGFALKDAKTKRVDVRSEPLVALGYRIRGTRIDPTIESVQKLFDLGYASASQAGLMEWQKSVRALSKTVHKRL